MAANDQRHECMIFSGRRPLSFSSFEDVIELLDHVGILQGDGVARDALERRAIPSCAETIETWP
jgi:hypothetical protein